jgi:hypothetical protein
VAITSLLILETAKELLRTLKRIEARMTLANPLEEERKILDLERGDTMTRAAVRNRAFQPDIWWHRYYSAIKNLTGEERKEERKLWKHIERTDRD